MPSHTAAAATPPGGSRKDHPPPSPPALSLDAPATRAALQRVLNNGNNELASAAAPLPSASSPAWLDAAARAAGAEDGGVTAATLLAASTPTAWTAPDAATRRAACRLAHAAMRDGTSSLPPAAACLAARGGVALLDDDECRTSALSLVAAAAAVLAAGAGQACLRQLNTVERTEAAQVAAVAAAAIASPPESVFGDAGGDPLDAPADAPAAAAWATRVDACLALATTLAAGVARPDDTATTTTARAPHPPPRPAPPPRLASGAGLWSVGDGTGGEAAAKAGLPTKSAPKGLVIEVIGGSDDDGAVSGEEEEERKEAAAVKAAAAAATAAACAATDAAVAVLLATALYCGGDSLDGAWAAPEAAAGAAATLAAATPFSPFPPPSLLFPLALSPLRATLVQAHWTGLDAVRMTAYEGPGVHERALASRQLAALVRGVEEKDLAATASAANLLPVVLAAADDPAPAVQRGGLAALAHLARTCPPTALGVDRALLLRAAKKAVVGCDGRAWPVAAGAAVAVVVALDAAAAEKASTPAATPTPPITTIGRSTTAFIPPPPAACLALLPDFLAEGERHAHERPRSLVWLGAAGPLLARCGAGCLALAPRLFPMLLRWLAAPDAGVRQGAGRALAVLLRATWPRAPAHAGHVWAHLAAARAGRPGDEPGAGEVAALEECAAVLWAASGEEFRESVRGGGGGGEAGGRALVAAVEGKT